LRDQIDIGAISSPTRIRVALVALWIAVVIGALAGLWVYKLRPGTRGELRPSWPAGSSLPASADRPTLIMFAHPRCVCTRASLAELRAVQSRFAGRIATYVVFMHPAGSAADWSHTDTWDTASSLAGVRVLTDTDGHEAERFGATTSGHVVLYDRSGRLLYSGGITPGRGHEGDSPQLDQLMRLIERETAGAAPGGTPAPTTPTTPTASTAVPALPAATAPTAAGHQLERPGPVFGCPLREEQP